MMIRSFDKLRIGVNGIFLSELSVAFLLHLAQLYKNLRRCRCVVNRAVMIFKAYFKPFRNLIELM